MTKHPTRFVVCYNFYLAKALLTSLLSPAETGLYRVLPLLGRDEEALGDLRYFYHLRNLTRSTDLSSEANLSESGLPFSILVTSTPSVP